MTDIGKSPLADDDFLAFLERRNLQEGYSRQKAQVAKSAKRDFGEHSDSVATSIENGIETARRHRGIVNACVFPFTRSRGHLRSETGYEFIRASPLYELGLENSDFLLFKSEGRRKIAVIGEAKGTVSSPESVVSEARSRLATAKGNLDHIKINYLKIPKDETVHLEYVLAVPINSGNDVLNSIIDTGGGLITWSIPLAGDAEIRLAFPPKSLADGIERKSMMHLDHKLNEALSGGTPSDRNEFSMFPQMHGYLELMALLRITKREGSKAIVTKDALRSLLSSELFYMDDDYRERKADSIVADGLDVGFLDVMPGQGVYKTVALGRNLNVLEDTLKKKWIARQLVRKEEQHIQLKVAELQDEFKSKKEKEKVWF
jgi:hypothetical protein